MSPSPKESNMMLDSNKYCESGTRTNAIRERDKTFSSSRLTTRSNAHQTTPNTRPGHERHAFLAKIPRAPEWRWSGFLTRNICSNQASCSIPLATATSGASFILSTSIQCNCIQLILRAYNSFCVVFGSLASTLAFRLWP